MIYKNTLEKVLNNVALFVNVLLFIPRKTWKNMQLSFFIEAPRILTHYRPAMPFGNKKQ